MHLKIWIKKEVDSISVFTNGGFEQDVKAKIGKVRTAHNLLKTA